MTGTLIVEVAEAGDDCLLKLFRTDYHEPHTYRLSVTELVQIVDALTLARQWMLPMVPMEFARSAGWRHVPDLRLHVPIDQPKGRGRVAYLARHPAHGWLAAGMLPSAAREIGENLLALASMAAPHSSS